MLFRSHGDERDVSLHQVRQHAVEMVGQERAALAAFRPARPEHEVVDEELAAPMEEICKRADAVGEHDACGVAMVATLNKVATHDIVQQGLIALRNLEHRGASGAEVNSGDGAGILIRIPDQFYREILPFELSEPGSYATGIRSEEHTSELQSH